jgi:hypothetical protein
MTSAMSRGGVQRIELSPDAAFARRVVRLATVSAIMLGVIWWLSRERGASPMASAWLLAGWIAMPLLLAVSLWQPVLRLLLIVPSTLVTAGVLLAAMTAEPRSHAGWLALLAGLLLGDVLGVWLWLGVAPSRGEWADPFSPSRWAAIGVHVALVLVGVAIVFAA